MAVYIISFAPPSDETMRPFPTSASASESSETSELRVCAPFAEEVTGAARRAGLDFMDGVRRGWGKRELAEWLLGAYAEATSFAPRGERVPRLEAQSVVVDEEVLIDLMLAVRAQVTATLDMIARTRMRPWFVDQAIERGHLLPSNHAMPSEDPRDALWLPRDRPGMRLGDRVLALFAADYLARPAAYERELYVCECDAVVFDEAARERGSCAGHDRPSGIVESRRLLGEDFATFTLASEEDDTQPLPFLLKKRAAR